MNEGTILSVGTTIADFILNLLDERQCQLKRFSYNEKTDTCRVSISLNDGYEVDAESFKEKVCAESDYVIDDVRPSMKGAKFKVTVNNCRAYFASTNQIVLEHKKRTVVFVIILFFVLLLQWTYHQVSS